MTDENSDSVSQVDPEDLLQQILGGGSSYARPGDAPIAGSQPSAPSPYARPGEVPIAGSPSPSRDNSLTSTDSNPAPAMPSTGFDPSKLPPGLIASPMTPTQVPQPPTGSSNPNLADLLKQRAAIGNPTDPSATDASGKPIYRMSNGMRVLGTAGNFLQGFGSRGHPERVNPVYVGPGATNARYGRDEAMRQGKVANLDTQISGQGKLDAENSKLYEDALRQAYQGQLGDARERTAIAAEGRSAAAGELADTREKLSASQIALNEARANKADQDKTPTNEFSGWYGAFKQQNGRNPSAKEIQQYEVNKARAGKDTSAADVQKAIQVSEYKQRQLDVIDRAKESERTRRYAELDKDVTVKYNPQKAAEAKQKVDSELETKYAPKVQQMSDEADKLLGLTKAGGKLKSGASPASSPPKPATPPPAGRTWVYDKKSGKVGHVPTSQLKQATSSGQYGNW
ncbi:MAG: hypothetical protein JWQ87_1691 [Candidatus Sulfotelmatobacter sp.]|nr:hypothetical protein [Candidatus Sulfotelmatobacter sp.]